MPSDDHHLSPAILALNERLFQGCRCVLFAAFPIKSWIVWGGWVSPFYLLEAPPALPFLYQSKSLPPKFRCAWRAPPSQCRGEGGGRSSDQKVILRLFRILGQERSELRAARRSLLAAFPPSHPIPGGARARQPGGFRRGAAPDRPLCSRGPGREPGAAVPAPHPPPPPLLEPPPRSASRCRSAAQGVAGRLPAGLASCGGTEPRAAPG